MPAFFFCFGYEDAIDAEVNSRLGTDGESSTGVFIDAPDEPAALEWGQEIAERFLQFEWQTPEVSWRDRRYAFWIEPNPATSEWGPILGCFPRVRVGELPDLRLMTTAAYVEWLDANRTPELTGY